jgi:hypothetical protein
MQCGDLAVAGTQRRQYLMQVVDAVGRELHRLIEENAPFRA